MDMSHVLAAKNQAKTANLEASLHRSGNASIRKYLEFRSRLEGNAVSATRGDLQYGLDLLEGMMLDYMLQVTALTRRVVAGNKSDPIKKDAGPADEDPCVTLPTGNVTDRHSTESGGQP